MGRFKAKFLWGGGLLVTAGVIFAKETFAWVIGQGWDAVVRVFGPEAPVVMGDLGGFPWLNALGLVLFVGGVAFLISAFRRSNPAQKTVANDSEDASKAAISSAIPDPPPLSPGDLYLGEILVNAKNVSESRHIELVFRCFNGYDHDVFFKKVDGTIAVYRPNKSDAIAVLPRPSYSAAFNNDNIPAKSEFLILLEQRLPSDVAALFDGLSDDAQLHLDLQKLEVRIAALEKPEDSVLLPIWGRMRVVKSLKFIRADRVAMISARSIELGAPTLDQSF